MATRPDIRSQLRTLSIPKDQRPTRPTVKSPGAVRLGKPVGILIVIVALTGGAYWAMQQVRSMGTATADASQVRLITITARDSSQPMPVYTATGKIVSDHKVLVNTKVSGQIVDLRFEQGDDVKDGQVLARIEDVLYKARRDQAAADLEKARASLAFQKINFDRVKRLFEAKNAPDIEFADATRALDEAKAQVAADTAELEFAQKALTDCNVLAPISGVVLERNVEIGDFVAAEGGRGAIANAQLCTIADMTKVRVEVDISELDVARIHKDMACAITPDAYKDRRYEGHVMWLDPGANYSKATVQAKVRVKNPDEFLRVEGSAQVSFLADESTDASSETGSSTIWIPSTACAKGEGDAAKVFVAGDGRIQATPIKLGRQVGSQVEVVSGLTVGQRIVADGLEKLTDGQRIGS
ncbi:hypothetical protein B7486_08495 [cyanobacterium TDX16]|nr:hypothetical protein B7486_08495 [cyanobacterium TDX16]